jgi:hypothetical protein
VLVFRGRDSEHFYALLIDPRKAEYSLRKHDGTDHWTDLIATKPSALIQQQDGLNQLRLDAAGDSFTLYVNGVKLDSARDSSYTFGMLGTIIANTDAGASTMRFDNLKIWSNDPPPRASTMPATRQALSGDMVLIPGGEFVIGSNDNPNDLPHIVAQTDFYIDSKEVTNVAYLTCADVSGCSLPNPLDSATHKGYATAPEFNFHPVVNVSWQQASFFCEQNGFPDFLHRFAAAARLLLDDAVGLFFAHVEFGLHDSLGALDDLPHCQLVRQLCDFAFQSRQLNRGSNQMSDSRDRLNLAGRELIRLTMLHVDDAHHAPARNHRNRQERMIAVFGQFGEGAEARISRGVALNYNRLAMPCDPACDALVERHAQAVYDFGMRILGSTQHQCVAFQHIDEAGVTAYKFGNKLDDLVEHLV